MDIEGIAKINPTLSTTGELVIGSDHFQYDAKLAQVCFFFYL
jgi:hypothetical protein